MRDDHRLGVRVELVLGQVGVATQELDQLFPHVLGPCLLCQRDVVVEAARTYELGDALAEYQLPPNGSGVSKPLPYGWDVEFLGDCLQSHPVIVSKGGERQKLVYICTRELWGTDGPTFDQDIKHRWQDIPQFACIDPFEDAEVLMESEVARVGPPPRGLVRQRVDQDQVLAYCQQRADEANQVWKTHSRGWQGVKVTRGTLG